MYSKEQASQLKQAFWTAFGLYMGPVLSAEGLRTNWINYKTGVKHIFFRMQADNKMAVIAIEIAHPDTELQQLFFEQFATYKTVLHNTLAEDWEWQLHTTDDHGKTISRIYTQISPVSIFQKEDWPKLISFFKPRIIALDEFWGDAKAAFEV
ncbi:DUF4268 domain-containing protein [Mucilaginibacter phyllosphaerae]|uniref:DUF4268 domain-containing protein n=1 Tax=Mucilaginibacter phyllosphaerae TaxID=1812349 RepID=A0A4Y8AJI6_9SPHI|nr:DUF4268 domain-containing protein [Mucilaginibacter phyllosphaerae]MBB3968320.1 hypothetical protein [Mucilaginibacter phyllosphaerae]TEW68681.1 DUF4268 domain-containing protein [Mucilaginibacter phyllosphaerae]GGG99741.1 hypothetical protein GCM10007352_00730 [Mucilaginibacter phyllosphaerae]